MAVTLEDVKRAAEAIRGAVVETPLLHSVTLSELCGAEIWCKFENLQFTASFKERGALHRLLALTPEERRRGVVTMSAGNHAQAVAHHARRLGVPAVIVMPRFTPTVKVEQTRAFGAEVVLHGIDLSQAHERARTLERERDLVLVHPYDDERVIAGQGTVGLEMLARQPDLEVLVVPVGGGGLVAGIAVAAHGVAPHVEVVGVETERFPSMRQALRGETVRYGRGTLAEGIAVKEPGRHTLPLVRELVREIRLVGEAGIEEAVRLLLEVEKTVVEGAGAVPLAAVREAPERFAGRRVGLVLSGGNIDAMPLAAILQRGLVRRGRLARVRVAVPDHPGALAEVARCIGDADANIVEVQHQRAFSTLPLQAAEVEFVLQCRGHDHLEEVQEALRRAGYAPQAIPLAPSA
ncbi:MAG: threonine ammonia-lyase [Myxococcota bacterium]|nr:threonine ammonia-lyase [Myxococcota bacterium]